MNTPTREVSLPLDAANDLAHGLVARLARDAGLRVLAIKGPVAAHHGLRPARTSADIDVLVAPGDAQQLLGRLLALGWNRRPESDAHRLFVRHSISLIHPCWPNDIDVHVTFPGMFVPAPNAFEALWNGHDTLDIGHVECAIPNSAGAFLIGALHALRSQHDLRSRTELALAHEWLEEHSECTQEVVRLAAATGADEVLADEFPDLGMPRFVQHSAAWHEWRVQAAQLNRTGSWLQLLLQTRGAQRLRIAKRAIVPSREAMTLDHPSVDGDAAALVREYMWRWIRALRALPEAYRVVTAFLASRMRAEAEGSGGMSTSRGLEGVFHLPVSPLASVESSVSFPQAPALNEPKPSTGSPAPAWSAHTETIYTLDATLSSVLTFSGPAAMVWRQVREQQLSREDALGYVVHESGMDPDSATQYLDALWDLWSASGVSP